MSTPTNKKYFIQKKNHQVTLQNTKEEILTINKN